MSEELKMTLGPRLMDEAPTHLLFFLSEPGMGLGFHVVEDFTSMKNGLIRSEKMIFDTLNMERKDMTMVPFSFKDMRIERMFDLNDLISDMFSLGSETPVLEPKTPGQEAANLSWIEYFEKGARGPLVDLDETEWSLLIQLVSYPDGTDQFHCEKSGLSRYRLKRIRDHLFASSLIKPLFIPNPVLIGLEVLIFSHMRFKPSVDPFEVLRNNDGNQPSNLILMTMDSQDAIGIGLYPNLAEGSRAQQALINAMSRMNILEGNPHVQIFSLGSMRSGSVWPLTFSKPLIQKGCWNIPDELMNWLKGINSQVPGSRPRNQRSLLTSPRPPFLLLYPPNASGSPS
jgi:hypothetical protein